MIIGFSSWALPWAVGIAGHPPGKPLRVPELIALAADCSAEVLQIADNQPLDGFSSRALTALAAEAGKNGVRLEIGTRGLDPANLLRHLEIAQALGARLVRTLPHDGGDRPDLVKALRRVNAVKRIYEDTGVTLAIENHDFYPGAWLRRLVEEAASPAVGICLDSANNLGRGESFAEVLANLGALTVNFHCKDYRIDRKPTALGFDVTGAPAGEGMLDLPLARRALPEGISWVIESWLPWREDMETTIRAEREWLLRGLLNLRSLRRTPA